MTRHWPAAAYGTSMGFPFGESPLKGRLPSYRRRATKAWATADVESLAQSRSSHDAALVFSSVHSITALGVMVRPFVVDPARKRFRRSAEQSTATERERARAK